MHDPSAGYTDTVDKFVRNWVVIFPNATSKANTVLAREFLASVWDNVPRQYESGDADLVQVKSLDRISKVRRLLPC